MGVTYFKLDSQAHGYPGDVTKGCSLTGGEIDNNFNFLRGYDIKQVSIKDNEKLVVERLDGEIIEVPFGEIINGYQFDYDDGTLIVTKPSGETVIIPLGSEGAQYTYSDGTLKGKGIVTSPLGLSDVYKSGLYSPVEEFVESLPEQPLKKGYRAISKEEFNPFGRLYSYDEIKKIEKELETSTWRVPTKEDWDKMLNSIEICDEDKTHDEKGSTKDLGKNAGAFLKSQKLWNDDEESAGEDIYGFSVLPVGKIAQRGYVEGSFKTSAWFWTDDGKNDKYIKGFDFNKRTVSQELVGTSSYKCSLRLVRDYNNDVNSEVEYINGSVVPCVLMPQTRQVWTQANVDISTAQGTDIGTTLDIWEGYPEYEKKVRYYINEWDGKSWQKKEMVEGDSVVIAKYNNGSEDVLWHEWRLLRNSEGDLILVDINQEFIDIVHDLYTRLITEENTRAQADEAINIRINTEIATRMVEDENINQRITNEVNALGQRITEETQGRIDNDTALGQRISEETQGRVDNDVALGERITNETNARVENDIAISQSLQQEISDRTESERGIKSRLDIIEGDGEGSIKKVFEESKTYTNGKVLEEKNRAESIEKTKVDKTIVSSSGKAMIFNEADGGGAKFEHADGSEVFIGVNDGGKNGLMAQIYADELVNGKWSGSRLNVYNEGIFYQGKAATDAGMPKNDPKLEIVVRGELLSAVTTTIAYVDDSVKEESERAKAAELVNANAIGEEQTARENADTEIKNNLSEWKIVSVTPSGEEYASSYELHDENGNTKGARINITRDKFIEDVKFGKFTWIDEDGNVHTEEYAIRFTFFVGETATKKKEVYVTVDDFLEHEFGKGLEIIDGKIQVRIDNSSENFLTVSDQGVKISGVQNAIDNLGSNINNRIDEIYGGDKVTGLETIHKIAHALLKETENRISEIETESIARITKDKELELAINFEITARTEKELELEEKKADATAVTEALSTKLDASVITGYTNTEGMNQAIASATEDMATQTWVKEQDYLVADDIINKADKSYVDTQDTKKVDKEIITPNIGKALIFNEIDGGGAKFEHTDGSESFVGVNNGGKDGLMAQIYADRLIDGKWSGSRINVYNSKIYYQSKEETDNNTPKNADKLEIAVKGDIAGVNKSLAQINVILDNLTEKIAALEEENRQLKSQVEGLENTLEKRIKDSVSNVLKGTDGQIKITKSPKVTDPTEIEEIKIGFDDNAQFIANIVD